jgi:peroxiredoxin
MKKPITRCLAAIALVLSGCGSSTGAGGVATGFSLSGLDGLHHSLTDYRGEVVLVNFWATWCIPCRAEMPDLEHEFRVHRSRGFVVLGVNWRESVADATSLARALGVSYPILLDLDGKVHDAYHVTGMPESFVVDRSGRLGPGRIGILSRDQLDKQIREALAR